MVSFVEKHHKRDVISQKSYYESCSLGLVLAEAYGGRSRRCAEVFLRTGR